MAVCLALVTVSSSCVSGEVLSTGVQAGTYYLKVATEMTSDALSSRRRLLCDDQQWDRFE